MKLKFLGHATCQLIIDEHKVLIDPYISDNPQCNVPADSLSCEHIILSHAHPDHYGDTDSIAKRCKATVIATYELAEFCAARGLCTHKMHIGGSCKFPFGEVHLTQALHGSSYPDANGKSISLGVANGILVKAKGKCIYHAGDTGLFGDMQLIGARNAIDLALIPIGDNFTMGPEDALEAVKMLKPKVVVPIHYNSWPLIEQDGKAFVKAAEALGFQAREMACGDILEL